MPHPHDFPGEILRNEADSLRLGISPERLRVFEDHMAEIFSAFGLDVNTPATQDTPRRFIRALVGVKRGGSHLFLRYSFAPGGARNQTGRRVT